jgi:hypothetical protein
VAFNFLAADAAGRHRARVAVRAVAGVFAAVALFALFAGWRASSSASEADAQLDEAVGAKVAAETRLREVTGGAENLPDHLDVRRDELAAAYARSSDVGALVAQVVATAPAGVEVLEVSVTDALGADEEGDAGGDAATSSPGSSNLRRVAVTARVPNLDAPLTWRNTLVAVGYLSEVKVEPTTEGGVVVSVTARLADGQFLVPGTVAAEQVGGLPSASPPAVTRTSGGG